MDVVLEGDHGQGKFRLVIKIILRDKGGKQMDSMVLKVGHVDYMKDMYEVLKSSISGPLNESMKEVINSGVLQLIRDHEDAGLSCWMKNHKDDQPLTIVSSLPIRVFVTGDLLSYFAAILGKVYMAGN
jgi:hypothetical protein